MATLMLKAISLNADTPLLSPIIHTYRASYFDKAVETFLPSVTAIPEQALSQSVLNEYGLSNKLIINLDKEKDREPWEGLVGCQLPTLLLDCSDANCQSSPCPTIRFGVRTGM